MALRDRSHGETDGFRIDSTWYRVMNLWDPYVYIECRWFSEGKG